MFFFLIFEQHSIKFYNKMNQIFFRYTTENKVDSNTRRLILNLLIFRFHGSQLFNLMVNITHRVCFLSWRNALSYLGKITLNISKFACIQLTFLKFTWLPKSIISTWEGSCVASYTFHNVDQMNGFSIV